MRALILIALIFFAADISIADVALDQAFIQRFADRYNANIDGAPGMLKEFLGDERAEISIVLNNGSIQQVGFEMKNARIVKTHMGGISNPTIAIGITESSINMIKKSNDRTAALQREMASGRLTFSGRNQITRAKLGLILSNMGVLRFLGSIF
jgi:hypothetical protein